MVSFGNTIRKEMVLCLKEKTASIKRANQKQNMANYLIHSSNKSSWLPFKPWESFTDWDGKHTSSLSMTGQRAMKTTFFVPSTKRMDLLLLLFSLKCRVQEKKEGEYISRSPDIENVMKYANLLGNDEFSEWFSHCLSFFLSWLVHAQ